MPVFVELVSDAFEEVLTSQSNQRRTLSGRSARAGNRVARRPTRGLEIKEDTYAAIKVILSDGTELPLVDSSSPDGISPNGYSNFILQSVSEARMEKHQIVETFGDTYIFFFGENPRFLDVQAVIVNSNDFNWEAEWWENYDQNFRGTKCVEKGGRLYLFYDDNIVEGYMVMSQAVKVSEQPHLIQMNFRLFLTNYRNVSFIGDPNFALHESSFVTDGADVTSGQLGTPRDQATSDASGDRGDVLALAASRGSFATAPRLSDLLRDASRTGAISPDAAVLLRQAGTTLPLGRSLPTRSLIADNLDEYVGLGPNQVAQGDVLVPAGSSGSAQSLLSPAARSQLEVDDLHQATVQQLSAQGAEMDTPANFTSLGLMPNFDPNSKTPATFRPQQKVAFGFDAGAGTVRDNPVDSTSGFRQNPLGAIFGGSVTVDRSTDNRFTQGAGDAKYGFKSDFAAGPGFGRAGFGDFGGPGFGSGQGATGDPGFKDPSLFTFAGVAQNPAAYNRFRKPAPDQSTFGAGAGIGSSSSGLSGGAAVRIGGKLSAFALVSVPGTLKRVF